MDSVNLALQLADVDGDNEVYNMNTCLTLKQKR